MSRFEGIRWRVRFGARLGVVIDVRFARASDGTHVAYGVLDADRSVDDVRDIVMVSGGMVPIEVYDQEPGFARMLDGLRALGRVVVFDRRGLGQSDPIQEWDRNVLDQWADDLAAVVDAVGARDVVLVAWDGFGVATRYAATERERVSALVLYEPFLASDDDWESGAQRRGQRNEANQRGENDILAEVAPSRIADRDFREWFARAGRTGASPSTALRIWRSVLGAFPSEARYDEVVAPTLVLHRRDNAFAFDDVLRLAREWIAGATTVELDGRDHFPFVGDVDALVAEIATFVVGEHRLPPPQRLVTAVLFTDLVGSTQRAAALGDAGWKSLLDRHDAAVRATVGRNGGSIIKTTGDGALALLPSAGACLRAAETILRDLAAEGLQVRIGAHVGDIDRRGDDVSGLAVNIASRVMSKAQASEIVVTESIVAAVVGQPIKFQSLGLHDLKGVPGTWHLYQANPNHSMRNA